MARRWLGVLALVALVAFVACKPRPGKRGAETTRAAPAPSTSARLPPADAGDAGAPATLARPVHDGGAPDPTGPVLASRPTGDACRVTRGPIQLSFTGPVTLVAGADDGEPRILFNRDGIPRSVTLPAPARKADPGAKNAKLAKPERLALGEPADRASSPGCAAAGGSLFCLDRSGALHRSGPGGEGSAVVAQARPGSPVAAATFGGGHVVYAFLADRQTSEGATTLAFAAEGDASPILLSEDGSGATFVSLASRGEEALAMYIDARRVLTPVHARVLTFSGKLGLGPDAVVFVGGGTDGRTPGAIAHGGRGHELVLLPIEKDERTFGLAAIRVEEQPRDDAATTWSTYPATPDRPAVAATQGAWPIRVLRVRPVDAQPRAKVLLELGEVDAAGVFKALCPVAEGTAFSDLAMLVDRTGALWIAYTDGDGTWVERRGN